MKRKPMSVIRYTVFICCKHFMVVEGANILQGVRIIPWRKEV